MQAYAPNSLKSATHSLNHSHTHYTPSIQVRVVGRRVPAAQLGPQPAHLQLARHQGRPGHLRHQAHGRAGAVLRWTLLRGPAWQAARHVLLSGNHLKKTFTHT